MRITHTGLETLCSQESGFAHCVPLKDIWQKLRILPTKILTKFIDKERHLAVLKTLRVSVRAWRITVVTRISPTTERRQVDRAALSFFKNILKHP